MYLLQKLFSQDTIEFRREVRNQCLDCDYDFYKHQSVYEKIECCNCNKTEVFKTAYQKDWWIDYLLADCRWRIILSRLSRTNSLQQVIS